MRILTLIILWVLVVLTGCQTNFETAQSPFEITTDEAPLYTPSTVSPTQGDSMRPSTSAIPVPENLIDLAKQEMAQRLSISIAEISLVEAKPVVWPDTSLGCRQEGIIYAQVLTPGYLILLQHAGNTFEYHTNKGRTIVTCEKPSPPVPDSSSDS